MKINGFGLYYVENLDFICKNILKFNNFERQNVKNCYFCKNNLKFHNCKTYYFEKFFFFYENKLFSTRENVEY